MEEREFEGRRAISFDSVEEMMQYQAEQEARAVMSTHPFQWSIGLGEYVIRPMDAIIIFGYIFEEAERNRGEDPETVEALSAAYERGYRYGIWHSVVVPDGEVGDAHVSTLWRIRKEEFDAAKAVGFNPSLMMGEKWFTDMIDRATAEAESSGRATESADGAGFTESEGN